MDALVTTQKTMSSIEIAQITAKRHDNVLADIRVMLEALGIPALTFQGWYKGANGKDSPLFNLPRRVSLILVSGYDVELRAKTIDRWDELERGALPSRPLTTAESFLTLAQITVDLERKQNEHSAAIIAMGERVHEIEARQSVMSSCPQAAEPITRIRTRMHAEYGVSAATVDTVMRQSPYAPKPAGMVKNTHESANESTYAVYWRKDVTATFRRFASECTQATATQCTHPFIEGRFKMSKKDAA